MLTLSCRITDTINVWELENSEFIPTPIQNNKIVWVTKHFVHLELKDMTLTHLQNSLKKCQRENWRTEAIPHLTKEITKRLKGIK